MAQLVNKFEIGCDPEFVLLNQDGTIKNVKGKIGEKGAVGWDHSGNVLELRPEQARGSYTLLRRMTALLEDPKLKNFGELRWRAGAFVVDANNGNQYGLGGHVHFNIHKTKWTPEMTGALDNLTQLLEHLEILPGTESKKRRAATQYGKPSDLRSDWADGHVEYRSMASFLHDPKVSFLTITAAKLAVCAPQEAIALKGKTSLVALSNFFERFRNKDINADRLLHNLERPKWLKTPPDADMKETWKCG